MTAMHSTANFFLVLVLVGTIVEHTVAQTADAYKLAEDGLHQSVYALKNKRSRYVFRPKNNNRGILLKQPILGFSPWLNYVGYEDEPEHQQAKRRSFLPFAENIFSVKATKQ